MAVQGDFTIFNLAKKRLPDGTIDLDTHTFKIVLTTVTQAIAATFIGSSTDCRYADLTNELTTAAGYTAAGATLGSVTWTQSTGTMTWDCADPAWTLTGGGVTFKYAIIYDDSATNKNLLCFCDMDTGGGSVSPLAGTLTIQINAAGVFTLA